MLFGSGAEVPKHIGQRFPDGGDWVEGKGRDEQLKWTRAFKGS